MEIAENRRELFDQIAESFSWALSHSHVSIESLGEFATLLYLIKHNRLYKAYNTDVVEGDKLFVLQSQPSRIAGDMERWIKEGIMCIGLMSREPDSNPEIDSILQRYRTSMRQHQAQEALIRTFDLIEQAKLQDCDYIPLLSHIEQRVAEQYGKESAMPIVPRSLGEMVGQLLHNKHQAIYDPFMGTASLLMDFPNDVILKGNEINPECHTYTTLKLLLRSDLDKCISHDITREKDHTISETCIVSFPPLIGPAENY